MRCHTVDEHVNVQITYGAELINLRNIKEEIKTRTHIPVASQRPCLGNLELQDDSVVADYNDIDDGPILRLVFEQGASRKGASCFLFFRTNRSSRVFCGDD
jgi:hypothetical protein